MLVLDEREALHDVGMIKDRGNKLAFEAASVELIRPPLGLVDELQGDALVGRNVSGGHDLSIGARAERLGVGEGVLVE